MEWKLMEITMFFETSKFKYDWMQKNTKKHKNSHKYKHNHYHKHFTHKQQGSIGLRLAVTASTTGAVLDGLEIFNSQSTAVSCNQNDCINVTIRNCIIHDTCYGVPVGENIKMMRMRIGEWEWEWK